MTFEFNDVWVLLSVFHSEEKSNGAELSKIISYADYVNRAIITYEELINGLSRMSAIGLVIQKENRFQTSAKFKSWYEKKFQGKKRIYYSTEQKEILKYLQTKPDSANLNPAGSITLSKEDYQLAVKAYTDRMSEILNRT